MEPADKPRPKRKTFFLWRLFFGDIDPLIALGYRTRLEQENLFRPDDVQTDALYREFEEGYNANEAQPTPLKRLVRSVIRGNGKLLVISGILYIIAQACTLAGPMLLQRIVAGLECAADAPKIEKKIGYKIRCEPKSQLYYYCIGLFLAPFIQSICENHYMYQLNTVGTKMRNMLMAAIYRKCLRLSNTALQQESTGKVVTLMSNDAQKLQDAIFGIHMIWGSPLYIVAILVLLYRQVEWATFVGLAVMILLVPISGVLAKKLAVLRVGLLKWTDKRVGRMNELIGGIQMIKFYAWEDSFKGVVMEARDEEAKILKKLVWLQSAFGMLLFAGPVAVAVCCFGSYELAGNHLSTAKAYAALSFFTLLRFPMSFLPMIITMLVNAIIGLRRIGAFLAKPEAGLVEDTEGASKEAAAPGEVSMRDGVFCWDEEAEKPALTGINIKASPGQLTMVVGSVGSGKSSVLSALIGTLTKKAGEVTVGGRVAYVAQTAWIINDTLQENVLLGAPLNPDAYTRALHVSQLSPDLEILPNGDMTEIGDRGITLSGGQKQRVSIARAVYSEADVYLLDDPLSAVDSHVGRALFEECIRGALKDKTVILVTNALQYLPSADNIVWMDGGAIKAQGTYDQLVAAGLNISELVHVEDEKGKEEGARKEGGKMGEADKNKLNRNITFAPSGPGANKNLTGEESREAGAVSRHVMSLYLHAGGGWPIAIFVGFLFAIEQVVRVFTDTWVGLWFQNRFNQGLWFYLGIYAALGVFFSLMVFIRCVNLLNATVNAAVNLHNRLLTHLLRLPKSFFDTNPSGRILNRFSRDTEILDSTLGQDMVQLLGCIATYFAILVVICIATKWFAIALVPITIVYFFVQRYYIPSARELQRIESITRSPIYSRFAEALLGVPTIRAYCRQAHFTAASDRLMAANAYAYLTQRLAASWLAMRLDLLGLFIITLAGILCIQGSVSPGLAGLCLVYALDLTRFLKHGTTMASKTEADLNSVERISQYLQPTPEASPDTPPEVAEKMPPNWPDKGGLALVKVQMRYRPDTPLVLKGVSFDVAAGEKVGIVGRTGSGKSSLFVTIFRMVEPESGSIIIDGVDCCRLGLRQLRSAMSIIPQDPFMFSGTVRHNLDPFSKHEDAALWESIKAVGLGALVEGLELGLQAPVVDNGSNFSQGQRQLFCLARAMLRRSRVLMLDEATASIDPETDAKLQAAIRTVFADTTMLTIAHRLNTIMDSDKAIVMDDGVVTECDEPHALLSKDEGFFTALVAQTGKQSAAYLRQVAQSASMKRSNSRNSLLPILPSRTLTHVDSLASLADSPRTPAANKAAPNPLAIQLTAVAADAPPAAADTPSTSSAASGSPTAAAAVPEAEHQADAPGSPAAAAVLAVVPEGEHQQAPAAEGGIVAQVVDVPEQGDSSDVGLPLPPPKE